MLYICNAFSLSMLDRDGQRHPAGDPLYQPRIPRPVDDPVGLLESLEDVGYTVVSAVGHANTAEDFSKLLGREVECNRVSIKLGKDDFALVGQYAGKRLAEGATELPESIYEWWIV